MQLTKDNLKIFNIMNKPYTKQEKINLYIKSLMKHHHP